MRQGPVEEHSAHIQQEQENEKFDVPERDIHLVCFLWWHESYIKHSLISQLKQPVKNLWQLEAPD